jgi:hypothetical protein
METCKKKLGADHLDTLTTINNLVFTWKGQGRDIEAISPIYTAIEPCLRDRLSPFPIFLCGVGQVESRAEIEQAAVHALGGREWLDKVA